MYGSPLRLPGELFAPSSNEYTDVTKFVYRLRAQIGKLRPVPASRHATPSTFIFKDLATASYVLLRHGALRGALQAPYVGPYEVLDRNDKTYKSTFRALRREPQLTEGNRFTSFILNTESASPPARPPGVTTRSGRRVRFPHFLECNGRSGGELWQMLQASSPS